MSQFLETRQHQPTKPTRFWCNHCDSQTVDSENPKTGQFYTVFGHGYSAKERNYEGEYVGVMFALCTRCKPI